MSRELRVVNYELIQRRQTNDRDSSILINAPQFLGQTDGARVRAYGIRKVISSPSIGT